MNDIAIRQGNKSIFIVIPARFASTRLPGKPLLKISSKSMISHVATRAKILADRLSKQDKVKSVFLIVATDHKEIFHEVQKMGILATMTPTDLCNGTERVFAAMNVIKQSMLVEDNDLVINIQGDEPFFSIDDIENLTKTMLQRENIPLGTLAFQRNNPDLFFTSSVVKVIRDENQIALYFSRAPIPYPAELLGTAGKDWIHRLTNLKKEISFLHHIGVYVFQYHALCKYAENINSSNLETKESLEQLRALEAGWKILVTDATSEPFGIDTPEDLERAKIYSQKLNEK